MGAEVFLSKIDHPPSRKRHYNPLAPARQMGINSPARTSGTLRPARRPQQPRGAGFGHTSPPAQAGFAHTFPRREAATGPAPTVAQHRARGQRGPTSRPPPRRPDGHGLPRPGLPPQPALPSRGRVPPSQRRFQPAAFGRCTAERGGRSAKAAGAAPAAAMS